MKPTLEEAKEWVEELFPPDEPQKINDSLTHRAFSSGHSAVSVYHTSYRGPVFTFLKYGLGSDDGRTVLKIPPTKEQFKTVLELTGVI